MHKNYKLVITGSNGSYTNMHCDHILENANLLHVDRYAIKDSLSVKFDDLSDIDTLKKSIQAIGTVIKVELFAKEWSAVSESMTYKQIFSTTSYDTFVMLSMIIVWDNNNGHKYVLSLGKSSEIENSNADELKSKHYFAYQADV